MSCGCMELGKFKGLLFNVEGGNSENPKYETLLAAGFDFKASLPKDEVVVLNPGETKAIPTGKRIEFFYDDKPVVEPINNILPELQVRSKSGMSLKGIIVANAPGTVDADFKGEIAVILTNISQTPFNIIDGTKLGQGVLCFVSNNMEGVEKVDRVRGEGGFGHTN